MSVQLIKIGASVALGHPFKVHPNEILCDSCNQGYKLHYSSGEDHRLQEWLQKAKAAVNKSHVDEHPDTVTVPW